MRAQRTHRTTSRIHIADALDGEQVSKPGGMAASEGAWDYCFQTENSLIETQIQPT